MSHHKTKESYSSLFVQPNTDLKSKKELPPEPIVKPEGVALPREKKILFRPKARDRGPLRQGMPPSPGEPTPPTPPSKPKPTPPEDWENEVRYPMGHYKINAAQILGIHRSTVDSWIIKGRIKSLGNGRISIAEIKRVKEGGSRVAK